jgi:hypothetical protein
MLTAGARTLLGRKFGSFNAFYIASKTTEELVKSWLHHFCPRFVLGKMFGKEHHQ